MLLYDTAGLPAALKAALACTSERPTYFRGAGSQKMPTSCLARQGWNCTDTVSRLGLFSLAAEGIQIHTFFFSSYQPTG